MPDPSAQENIIAPDLENVLLSIENQKGFLDYHGVESSIRKAWQDFSTDKPPFEWLSEIVAFQFMEEHPGNIEGYGEYFGPMMEGLSADGTPVRIPDAKIVTPDMINYWAERAKASEHPVMAARYAGLVFDLSKVVTGKPASFEMAEIYFNNLLKISEDGLQEHEMDIVHKLERALHVAISMKNDEWLAKARQETLACQDRINRDDAPGYWATAYRLLLENKKSKVTAEEEHKIIQGLEERLSSLGLKKVNEEISDPWNFQSAAEPLANYYRRKNKKEDLERIINVWGNAFETAVDSVSGMLASSWLQHIHDVYMTYGFKEKAENVAIKLHEAGQGAANELGKHTFEFKVPKEEIDKIVNAVTDKDLNTAFVRLALNSIPKIEGTRQRIDKLFASSSISYFFSRQIMDQKGRVVAIVGPYEQDPTGHIVQQMSQDLDLDQIFFHPIIMAMIEKLDMNTEKLMTFVSKSSILEPERLGIIKKGVSAYFNKDFFVAAHILIPQIEQGIRNLHELFGGAILKPRKGGGYHYKTLDELLREETIQKVLGKDCAFYMQVILTDARGWNLRNDICHGLLQDVSEHHIERIIHILLCLALIRPKE